MSEVVKLGPVWNRLVFDGRARVIKRRGRTLCRFEDLQGLRLREWVNRDEEEQLLNVNIEVQKAPREAELWADTRGGAVLLGTLDQAGLLLQQAADLARTLKVALTTERATIGPAEPRGRRST